MTLALYRRNGSVNTESGPSSIVGTLNVNSVPSKREVLLMDMDSKLIKRSTYSDTSGNYSFLNLQTGKQWLLLFIDGNGVYNAVAKSHINT